MKNLTGKYKEQEVTSCQTIRTIYTPKYFFGLIRGTPIAVTLQVCLLTNGSFVSMITFPPDLKIKNIEKVFKKEISQLKEDIIKLESAKQKLKSNKKVEFDEFVDTRKFKKPSIFKDDLVILLK